MLEMREACEYCKAPTPPDSANVVICSYECTFCRLCADRFEWVCPNCGGTLVDRPTRSTTSPASPERSWSSSHRGSRPTGDSARDPLTGHHTSTRYCDRPCDANAHADG